MNQPRTTFYGGHMHKTNKKKKTRYTDDEIDKIKQEAYDRGRTQPADSPASAHGPSYAQGVADGRAQALSKVFVCVDELHGRTGKRKILEVIEEIRETMVSED